MTEAHLAAASGPSAPPSNLAAGESSESLIHAITELEGLRGSIPQERALAVLLLRDSLGRRLREGKPSGMEVQALANADRALRRLSARLERSPELLDWRRSLAPPAEAWWWYPDESRRGQWKALSLLFAALTATLVLDIAGRFGPAGWNLLGAGLVVLPTVLAAITAGGALSKTVEEFLHAVMRACGVPNYRRSAALAAFSAAVCLFAFCTWTTLPWLSVRYGKRGVEALEANRLAVAEEHLRRAVRLDPDNSDAHYHLGDLYERVEERDEAIREYRVAVAAGLDLAANNLGRLLLLKDRPDSAVQILAPVERQMRGVTVEKETRYSILKNLGWARVAQGRPADALSHLEEARQLDPTAAPAHCLLGKALARLGDRDRAAAAWKECLARSRESDPDEDRWISEADTFFAEARP